jgi:polyvinyl alcohol dehydrogenase (cytochrome)
MMALALAATVATTGCSQWTMFGQNLNNTASTSGTKLNVGNVSTLKPKWVFTAGADITARAAVANGVAYFPDWSGHLYAVRSDTGKLLWSKSILTAYMSGVLSPAPTSVVSRTSPFLDTTTNTLYIGTQEGAYMLAINAANGALRWRTQLDSFKYAIDTGSPIVNNGVVYVGVSSGEEAYAAIPGYPCCSFRGSVVALNAHTGARLWKTFMVPPGYTGGAVWSSTIVPDPTRGVVYVTTGNNYSTPTDPAYTACITAGGTPDTCNSPDDHLDSVLALRMSDGTFKWSTRLSDSDDWNFNCIFLKARCPVNSGSDFDFGSGVQLLTIQTPAGPKTILGAGQKSGVYSAFDPDTGHVLWATQVGPGGGLGGIEWGSATDGTRIYVAITNSDGLPYTNPNRPSLGTSGSWAALDPATGRIDWQVADPNAAPDFAPLSVADGVVYAASMGGSASTTAKTMFGLNAATGATLWSYPAGSSVNSGAVIANDTVFWGSGYGKLFVLGFTGNKKLYAFTLGGK